MTERPRSGRRPPGAVDLGRPKVHPTRVHPTRVHRALLGGRRWGRCWGQRWGRRRARRSGWRWGRRWRGGWQSWGAPHERDAASLARRRPAAQGTRPVALAALFRFAPQPLFRLRLAHLLLGSASCTPLGDILTPGHLLAPGKLLRACRLAPLSSLTVNRPRALQCSRPLGRSRRRGCGLARLAFCRPEAQAAHKFARKALGRQLGPAYELHAPRGEALLGARALERVGAPPLRPAASSLPRAARFPACVPPFCVCGARAARRQPLWPQRPWNAAPRSPLAPFVFSSASRSIHAAMSAFSISARSITTVL